jgi:6-phosphofructokinase 2
MESIVTVTINPSIDISTNVEHVVNNRKLRCNPPCYKAGGGGINVSRAIKKLGGESTALYTVGGVSGKILSNLLEQEGIQQHPVSIEGTTRENFIVSEKSSGDQYHFNMPGSQLHESEWKQCFEELHSLEPKPTYIVGSGSLAPGVPEDFYARMAEIASELGARFIVNASGKALSLAAQRGVYFLKPNIHELQELGGQEIQDEQTQEQVAMKIVENGRSEVVVVSLGAAGVLIALPKGIERLRAPSVEVKSDVGAGDSLIAGIVLKLAQGESIREAVRFGIAAGTATTMRPGTQLCEKEDVERLYDKMVQEEFESTQFELPDFSDVPNIRR